MPSANFKFSRGPWADDEKDMNDADTYREKHTTAFGSGQLRTVCTSAPYFV